jgi:hypothetical protein
MFPLKEGITMGSKIPASGKLPVSRRAIVQRINRKLADKPVQLCKNRQEDTYYLIDTRRNRVLEQIVDLEEKARELEVLRPWEEEAYQKGGV